MHACIGVHPMHAHATVQCAASACPLTADVLLEHRREELRVGEQLLLGLVELGQQRCGEGKRDARSLGHRAKVARAEPGMRIRSCAMLTLEGGVGGGVDARAALQQEVDQVSPGWGERAGAT